MSPHVGNVIVTAENRRQDSYDVPIFRAVTVGGHRYWLFGRVLLIRCWEEPR